MNLQSELPRPCTGHAAAVRKHTWRTAQVDSLSSGRPDVEGRGSVSTELAFQPGRPSCWSSTERAQKQPGGEGALEPGGKGRGSAFPGAGGAGPRPSPLGHGVWVTILSLLSFTFK